jgi:hypothetical protein
LGWICLAQSHLKLPTLFNRFRNHQRRVFNQMNFSVSTTVNNKIFVKAHWRNHKFIFFWFSDIIFVRIIIWDWIILWWFVIIRIKIVTIILKVRDLIEVYWVVEGNFRPIDWKLFFKKIFLLNYIDRIFAFARIIDSYLENINILFKQDQCHISVICCWESHCVNAFLIFRRILVLIF